MVAIQSRTRFRRIRLLAVAALAAAALPLGPSAESLELPTRIYFKQGKNIYSVDADGSNRRLIAKGAAFPGKPALLDPAVSPNGKRIAVSAAGHLWVGKIGGGAKRITRRVSNRLNLSQIRYPTWSPDNKKLAFQAVRKQRGMFTARLYRINADGTGIKQLLKFSGHFGSIVSSPDWSSQNEIAYAHADDLWRIKPDGTGKTNITQDGDNYFEPSWDPKGEKIAVIHDGPGGDVFSDPGIWAVDRATGNVTAITGDSPDTNTKYLSPSWSPLGNNVAFSGHVDGDVAGYTYDLYVVPSTGGTADDLDQSTPTRTQHVLTPDWAMAPPT